MTQHKRALVTGGAGFLGSHLCGRLLDEGLEVVCMDNLITGSLDNIEGYFGRSGFTFVHHDVTNFIHVPGELDYILHFASPASPVDFDRFPIQIMKAGGVGTLNALGLAKAKKAKFLLASSSEVYGDPLVNPQTEDYWGRVNPIGIRSCYDEGKRCAETLFMDYHRQHNLQIKIARIFNTYGPRMHSNDGRVVSNFVVQALKGEPITIYGDGQQTRSFCYVDEMVDAFVRLMNSDDEFIGPVNLGNPGEFTIRELAEKTLAMTNSSSELINMPLPQDDPTQRQPNIALAKEKLGWEPVIKLEEGLGRTIDYFKSIINN